MFEKSSEVYHRRKKKLEMAIKKKESIHTRLLLSKIVELHGRLTKEQKEAIESIGLGGLLRLKYSLLKHQLCPATLDVHGKKIEVTTTSKGRSIGARELSIERELDRVKIDVQELKDQLKENTSAVLEMTRVFKQLVDRLELPLTDNMEKKVKKVKKNEFRENEGERQDVKVWMVMNVNEFQEGCGKSKGKKNESQKIDIEGPYHGWSPFFLRMFAKLRVKMLL